LIFEDEKAVIPNHPQGKQKSVELKQRVSLIGRANLLFDIMIMCKNVAHKVFSLRP
jgi:hypothetical protein